MIGKPAGLRVVLPQSMPCHAMPLAITRIKDLGWQPRQKLWQATQDMMFLQIQIDIIEVILATSMHNPTASGSQKVFNHLRASH